MLSLLLLVSSLNVMLVLCELFAFPESNTNLSKDIMEYLNGIPEEDLAKYEQLGIESVDMQVRLEENLFNSDINVENGSISHEKLLESLPDIQTRTEHETAMKILKASLYFLNKKCLPSGINGAECEHFLRTKLLLRDGKLMEACSQIMDSKRDGHHSFRRLLPRNYADDFYQMFAEDKLPPPRYISTEVFNNPMSAPQREELDDMQINLVLVQWAQFIEHDLSKPVLTSMKNSQPIQCCNQNNYKLSPRHRHPACVPLYGKDVFNKYGKETCLNYVRSALSVGPKCSFGEIEQLNQATGFLDLSQLYGFPEMTKNNMRLYKNGKIKFSTSTRSYRMLLPLANTGDSHLYCITKSVSNSTCFMAGDSRVNSNPFSIVIYTLFLRNHNQLANNLRTINHDWTDERIFQHAKAINVYIYRQIIFEEWLPQVVGYNILNDLEILSTDIKQNSHNGRISNEFAVAAIRFYISMMPDSLYNFSTNENANHSEFITNNFSSKLFKLRDQMYQPNFKYTFSNIDSILDSMLHQCAMKVDPYYVESFVTPISAEANLVYSDTLAFDIQRGRDHGLQGYVSYVEVCNGIKVNSWKDLEILIKEKNLNKLQSVYKDWSDIDLIIGGLSENPINGSLVGPTFSCILAEQFFEMRNWKSEIQTPYLERFAMRNMSAAQFLCLNSDLKNVPANIFKLRSEKNSLMSCKDLLVA